MIVFLALAFSAMAYCQEKFNPTIGSEIVYKVPKYVEPTWGEGDYELCPALSDEELVTNSIAFQAEYVKLD